MARSINNQTARGIPPTPAVQDVRGLRRPVIGFTPPLALTTDYQAVGTFIPGAEFEDIRYLVDVDPGNATSIDFRVEVDGKDEADGYAKFDSTGTLADTTIAVGDIPTNGRVSVRRGLEAAGHIRLLAKRTGGTNAAVTKASYIVEPTKGV